LVIGKGEQSYADQLHPTAASLLANIHNYGGAFMGLWLLPWGKAVSIPMFAITTGLAGLGMRKHIEMGLTTLEAFLVPYLAIVWLWPSSQGLRFLLPVIPFYIFLMFLGIEELAKLTRSGPIRIVATVPVLVIVLSYSNFFRFANYGAIQQTDGRPSFVELCTFIKANTGPDDTFIFRRSRALSLFTARAAGVYSLSQLELASDLERLHAAYIVTSPIFEEDRKVLIPFVRGDLSQLNEVYENSDFRVYRIDRHPTVPTGRGVADSPSLALIER
jgi:hypothetical protein